MIHLLPPDKQYLASKEFYATKRSKSSAYLCRFFGFFQLYKGNALYWILHTIACFFVVGLIRRIYDLSQVSKYVDEYNHDLEHRIYLKYSS